VQPPDIEAFLGELARQAPRAVEGQRKGSSSIRRISLRSSSGTGRGR
jgi:hypothetical protein